MTRLPDIERDSLQPDEQRIWDKISESRGGMSGPYRVMMRVPKLAEQMASLGDYFRSESQLSGADRELAILASAREIGSRYQWVRHEQAARDAGTRAEAIEELRIMSFKSMLPRELVIVEVVQSLFRTRSLPPLLFEKALAQLGETKLVELVTLTGFYCSIAFTIMAFEVALPEGTRPPF